MAFLLVDDRDGRILAEVRSEDEALRVLEAMASEDPLVPEYLCLVESHSHAGSVLETDTTLKFRTLR